MSGNLARLLRQTPKTDGLQPRYRECLQEKGKSLSRPRYWKYGLGENTATAPYNAIIVTGCFRDGLQFAFHVHVVVLVQ